MVPYGQLCQSVTIQEVSILRSCCCQNVISMSDHILAVAWLRDSLFGYGDCGDEVFSRSSNWYKNCSPRSPKGSYKVTWHFLILLRGKLAHGLGWNV